MPEHPKTFIPGFETRDKAVKAGASFFAKANGKKAVENRDFHIVTNEHGRFHFEDGPARKVKPAA